MIFELPVAEERVKKHQVTGLHLLTAFVFTGSGALIYWLSDALKLAGIGLLVVGLLLFFVVFFGKKLLATKANLYLRVGELVICLSFLAVSVAENRWIPIVIAGILSIALLFSIIAENQNKKAANIRIDERGISLPFITTKRFIKWSEIEKVILRFGILTVDCYDNHLSQWHVGALNADIKQFDDFCTQQIAAGLIKRKEEEW